MGLPLAVVYKFVDDQGGYLAALITYYGFLSLFPLLLLAVTVLGYVLQGDPGLQDRILGSALAQFPVIGAQLRSDVRGYTGSGVGLVVGLLGALYGGTGVAQAVQNAVNQVYAVPRNERPNPVAARVRSLGLLATLGLGVLLTTALNAFPWSAVTGGSGLLLRVVSGAVAVAANLLIFVAAFRVLSPRDLSVRDVLLGTAAAAVLWQVLQSVGSYYVRHELAGSSQLYGTFGAVLGLLAWIYLQSLVVVLALELNVVVRRRLWPRALLTPFTDAVDLTRADQRAYTAYAQAQRTKGFERVDVDFDGERGGRPGEVDLREGACEDADRDGRRP